MCGLAACRMRKAWRTFPDPALRAHNAVASYWPQEARVHIKIVLLPLFESLQGMRRRLHCHGHGHWLQSTGLRSMRSSVIWRPPIESPYLRHTASGNLRRVGSGACTTRSRRQAARRTRVGVPPTYSTVTVGSMAWLTTAELLNPQPRVTVS